MSELPLVFYFIFILIPVLGFHPESLSGKGETAVLSTHVAVVN